MPVQLLSTSASGGGPWPKHGQLFSVLASNGHHCHPANGILNLNNFLVSVINLNFLAEVT